MEEKGTVVAHNMTAWDNQPPKVISPIGTELNSILGVTKSTPTWMFSLNTSEVSID
jgi:hypothetical protein